MSKIVRIAELKANLRAYVRMAKGGETITVMDRDTPVAKLVPIDASSAPLQVRRARKAFGEARMPRPLKTRSDVVALLIEERGDR